MLSIVISKLTYIKNVGIRSFSNTIFAVSSGRGKCGVAVVRVSGPDAGMALQLLTNTTKLPKPRYALLKHIQNPQNGEILDKGIVIWFPGPKSFTGEDSCEFQVHGGSAVISAVLSALGSINNVRLAEPGEFTKRAFYNGKLDLTEVEGVSDLLAAETEAQRKQALFQVEGSLSKVYYNWKDRLVKCLANLEADIDFGETETIDDNIVQVNESIQELCNEVSRHLVDGRKGERLRNGVKTVILGEPNVGKSSLFNILCQRPAAIVTPIEGTTRDLLQVMLDINGYPLLITDTAGLRSNTRDLIESEGIQRALNASKSADLILLVINCTNYLSWYSKNCDFSFVDYLKEYLKKLKLCKLVEDSDHSIYNIPTIIIMNKADLLDEKKQDIFKDINVCLISCKSESGISELIQELTNKLQDLCGKPSSEHPNMNQMRHRQYLHVCLECLEKFLLLQEANTDFVLLAEELRKALRQIGKITGTVSTEQLLDVIFKDFCIGK